MLMPPYCTKHKTIYHYIEDKHSYVCPECLLEERDKAIENIHKVKEFLNKTWESEYHNVLSEIALREIAKFLDIECPKTKVMSTVGNLDTADFSEGDAVEIVLSNHVKIFICDWKEKLEIELYGETEGDRELQNTVYCKTITQVRNEIKKLFDLFNVSNGEDII